MGPAGTEKVVFESNRLKLAGVIHWPVAASGRERAPAFLVLHGFGSTKDSNGSVATAQHLATRGYLALRFDFRGCGESEGERGLVLCLDQVADTRSAVSYLQSRPDVDAERIGLVGASFGGAVAIYAGGTDERVGAVISIGGWGNGERKFRRQHPTPEAWARFKSMLDEGRRRSQRGERMMVPRYDIVPIPEHLRHNVAPGSHQEFPWEVPQGMYDFRADDVVANIAPRPLLLIHAAADSVTPTQESVELFLRSSQPAELHLFAEVDHFLPAERPSRVMELLDGWLERYFPARSSEE